MSKSLLGTFLGDHTDIRNNICGDCESVWNDCESVWIYIYIYIYDSVKEEE